MELTRTDRYDRLIFTLETDNEHNRELLKTLERGRRVRITRKDNCIVGTVDDINLDNMRIDLVDVAWLHKTVIADGYVDLQIVD